MLMKVNVLIDYPIYKLKYSFSPSHPLPLPSSVNYNRLSFLLPLRGGGQHYPAKNLMTGEVTINEQSLYFNYRLCPELHYFSLRVHDFPDYISTR